MDFFRKTNKFYHSCLNTDSYDKRAFNKLMEISPRLQTIEADGDSLFPGYVNFMGDLWSSLYKTDPQINPMAGERGRKHQPLIQKIVTDEKFEELKKQTTLDDFSAAIASISLNQQTIEEIKRAMAEKEEFKEKMEEMKKTLRDIKKNQKAQEKRDLKGKGPTKKQEEKAQELEAKLQQLQQEIAQEVADNMAASLAQIAAETKDTKKGVEDLVSGINPGVGIGEIQKIPLREQLVLAEKLKNTPRIKEVAKWAGRFKNIARKKQKSKHIHSAQREGIVKGSDINLLLPTELAQLKNPLAKYDFFRKFAEKSCLQYNPKGKEVAGKGPIILCLDQSGSMDSIKEQSAGFALAIAMVAKKQRRDFCYIPFSGNVPYERVLDVLKGKLKTEEILKIATEFINGGTNFEEPLAEGLRMIQKKKRYKNADIIFVTDGQSSVSEGFLAFFKNKKQRLKFQIKSVLIGDAVDKKAVEIFSDEMIFAADFIDAANKSNVFAI